MPIELKHSQGLIAIGARLTNQKNMASEDRQRITGATCIVALRMDGFPACVFYENTIHGSIWRSQIVNKVLYTQSPDSSVKIEIHTVFPKAYASDQDSMGRSDVSSDAYQGISEREQWKALWSRARNVQSKYLGEVTAGLPADVALRYMNTNPRVDAIGERTNSPSPVQQAERLLFEAKKIVEVNALDPNAEIEYMISMAHENGSITESDLSPGKPGSSLGLA